MEFERAKPSTERALAVQEKAFGSDQPKLTETLNTLADIHKGLGGDVKALVCMDPRDGSVQSKENLRGGGLSLAGDKPAAERSAWSRPPRIAPTRG